MPNFLVLDSHFGANCAAFSYANATPTQIGDAFGTADTHGTQSQMSNRLVQFGGELYAMAQNGIYQKDDPASMSGAWTQQIAFASTSLAASHWGLYALEVNGVMHLIGVRPAAGVFHKFRWVKFDGTTWTEQASDTGFFSVASSQPSSVVAFHNTLFFVGGFNGTPDCISYNPASEAYVNLKVSYNAQLSIVNTCLCVFEDRLFAIGSYDSGGSRTYRLAEFSGSSWISVETFEPFLNSTSWQVGKWSLFTDGTNMYALVGDDSGGTGWRCFQWNASITRTEKTVDVLPTSLRWTGAAGGAWSGQIGTARFAAIYDLDSVVGTTDIYLYHATNGTAGTGFAAYKWNGNAALMTSVDSGGNVDNSLPHSHLMGGERIFTVGELDIEITNWTGVFGGEEISFVAHGGGTGHKMKLHYTQDGTPPLLEATLALPVTGGSATFNAGLNQVEGIAADGLTVYTIIWDIGADGLSTSNRVGRVPQILI